MYKKIKVIVIFSFITIGFILIILGFYFKEKQQNKKEDTFKNKY